MKLVSYILLHIILTKRTNHDINFCVIFQYAHQCFIQREACSGISHLKFKFFTSSFPNSAACFVPHQVQLLNQEEDRDHVVSVIRFDDDTWGEYGSRVTEGERSVSGRGTSNVFLYSELEKGYLKDDCLKFCVTKVVLR